MQGSDGVRLIVNSVSTLVSTLAVVEAYESVSTVIETLEAVRISVTKYHDKWYNDAVTLAVSVDVTPNMPRICANQIHRTYIPAENVSEYYRRTITLPVLNEVISDLLHRFNPVNMVFIGGIYCFPSLMEKYPNEWKKILKNFMISHVDDMPSIDRCDAKIDCWETFWFSSFKGDDLPDTVETTLQHTMIAMCPNSFAVLTLLGVIPVTTCSCERCISVLLFYVLSL